MILFDSFAMIGESGHRGVRSLRDADEFVRRMDHMGIARSLAHHFIAREVDPLEGNERVLRMCRGSDRLSPCAVLYPSATGEHGEPAEYMERMVSEGVRGFRFCPAEGRYRFLPFVIGDWCELLIERGLPAFVDFGVQIHFWDHMPDFEAVYAVCQAFPELNVVVGHLGAEANRMLYATMRACPNLHCDLSTLGAKFVDDAAGRFGAERVLFSTQMPIYDPGSSVTMVKYCRLPEADVELVAGGNLSRLLGEN